MKKQPSILTIVGGGYIAFELAHFYGILGTKINIIQRNDVLVPREGVKRLQISLLKFFLKNTLFILVTIQNQPVRMKLVLVMTVIYFALPPKELQAKRLKLNPISC
ncbi:MAG: NAD-binding protein [Thermoproteota archaeon]|nr:NAD-binding protein [Thermoproteota archaeon]